MDIHKGFRFIINEFNRRRLYYHDLTTNIKNYIDKCKICVEIKLNNYIKPPNKQIISRFPLERVLMDITYFSYINNNIKINKTYILNILDHYSKFACSFIQKNKSAKEVLTNLKIFIKRF